MRTTILQPHHSVKTGGQQEMKRIPRLFAIILISVVSGVLLSACSDRQHNANQGVTINIMQSKVEDNTQFKQLAAKYEQIHPNVKVIVTSVGGGTDYLSTLKTRMSAGDEPTIFSITGPSDVSQGQRLPM
jgi:raffinose/stachyose/melibiose transport system substrate-binding protein